MVTHQEYDRATKTGLELQKRYPRIISAEYNHFIRMIVVRLSDGSEASLSPGVLGPARESDLAVIEISPNGLGLHWPKIDADLYLPNCISQEMLDAS